jgi:ubiquitin C-terminal hydrolase
LDAETPTNNFQLLIRTWYCKETQSEKKNATPVRVPRLLNMEHFAENTNLSTKYALASVAIHRGELPTDGHYVAAQRHRNELVEYDDSTVILKR